MRVYFGENSLVISDRNIDGALQLAPDGEWGVSIERLLSLFEISSVVVLRGLDEQHCKELSEAFARQFVEVTAAGGAVESDDGSLLMIYRNGRWDLPKGHWEEGETIEECAIREVEEECGISGLTLGSLLCETLHTYRLRGRWELKRTYWYSMRGDQRAPLTPQREEGIERVEWLSPEQQREVLRGSFQTIKSVVASLG